MELIPTNYRPIGRCW